MFLDLQPHGSGQQRALRIENDREAVSGSLSDSLSGTEADRPEALPRESPLKKVKSELLQYSHSLPVPFPPE